MENYKAKEEDVQYAKNIYETIILQQVLQPHSIMEAHKRLFGYTDNVTIPQMKNNVFLYFQYEYKNRNSKIEDKTQTNVYQDVNGNVITEKIDKRTKEYKEKNNEK